MTQHTLTMNRNQQPQRAVANVSTREPSIFFQHSVLPAVSRIRSTATVTNLARVGDISAFCAHMIRLEARSLQVTTETLNENREQDHTVPPTNPLHTSWNRMIRAWESLAEATATDLQCWRDLKADLDRLARAERSPSVFEQHHDALVNYWLQSNGNFRWYEIEE